MRLEQRCRILNDNFMKKIALGVSAAALLLFTQPGIAVSGLGGGGKGGHAFKFFGHHHHKHSMQHNKNWWWYYGYGGVYATQPSATETVAVPVAVAPVETRTCVRVQQPMTVRSEDGGERTVYVTRCQD
jgi:hypothetical protein